MGTNVAFSVDGHVALAYFAPHSTGSALQYAVRSGSRWSRSVVSTTANSGISTAVVAGTPVVAWFTGGVHVSRLHGRRWTSVAVPGTTVTPTYSVNSAGGHVVVVYTVTISGLQQDVARVL